LIYYGGRRPGFRRSASVALDWVSENVGSRLHGLLRIVRCPYFGSNLLGLFSVIQVVLATADKSQQFFASILAGKNNMVGISVLPHFLARLGPPLAALFAESQRSVLLHSYRPELTPDDLQNVAHGGRVGGDG
jgi:hypothetical protein